jgi:hypothetical protein
MLPSWASSELVNLEACAADVPLLQTLMEGGRKGNPVDQIVAFSLKSAQKQRERCCNISIMHAHASGGHYYGVQCSS